MNPSENCHQCSSLSCVQEFEVEPDFKNKLIDLLKVQPHTIQELKQKLYFEPLALKNVLETLLSQQQIKQVEMQKYYWNHE